MRCSRLAEFIPFGTGAKKTTKDTCKNCLMTTGANPCPHFRLPNWKDFSCPVTKMNILICRKYDHKRAQEWMKNNFNPRIGKHNFTNMIKAIGNDEILVNVVRVDSNDHEDYEEEMEVDKEDGSCNQAQVDKDTHQISALASIMDGLAITSIDNISLADNE